MFGLCQIHAFVDYLRFRLSTQFFTILFKSLALIAVSVAAIVGIILSISGKVSPWTGRLVISPYTGFSLDLRKYYFGGGVGGDKNKLTQRGTNKINMIF